MWPFPEQDHDDTVKDDGGDAQRGPQPTRDRILISRRPPVDNPECKIRNLPRSTRT